MDAGQFPSALIAIFSNPGGLLEFLFIAFFSTIICVFVMGGICEGISRLYHFLRRIPK